MSDKSYFTQEGYQSAMEELQSLKTKDRAELAEQIEEAREKGDLRENAEYKAAKERQGLLELKIAKMEAQLASAVIVDTSDIDLSKVSLLCTVKVKNLKTNTEAKYTIVPESEQNLKEGKISIKSPVGMGLTGKKVGEVAEVKAPAGIIKFEVLDITLE